MPRSARGTWFRSQAACANARKRLPSNAQWQANHLGSITPQFSTTGMKLIHHGLGSITLGQRPHVSKGVLPVLTIPLFAGSSRTAAPVDRLLRIVVTIAALSAIALPANPAGAATLNVDTTVDAVAKSACDDAVADDCSLRGAVSKANGTAAHDTIVVPAGTYTLSVASPCFFAAAVGDSVGGQSVTAICLNSDLDIVGAGRDATFIQQIGTDRIFAISKAKTVNISAVTLSGGRGGFGFQIGGGAGINNHGTLTLSDSLVTNNQLVNGSGGGLHNIGTLTVLRSAITGNSTNTGVGGGISNTCCPGGFSVPSVTLTVIDSTISTNGAQNGGGIANTWTTTVINSTIDGNTANLGGGIYQDFGGVLTVRNSTISGNTGYGGGIGHGGASTHIESSTITRNNGTNGPGGFYFNGNHGVTMRNTIVAGNTSTNGSIPDCGGPFTSQGYNLIGVFNGSCPLTGDTTGNVLNVSARLGELADNGGPTRTHAPLGASGAAPASPAIDAANPADPASGGLACPAIDQRAVLRPIGARCDIGAFERGGSLAVTKVAPARAGNAGPLAVILSGSGFEKGATVTLSRSGEPDVAGTPVNVESAGASLATSFDLAGRALGAWDVTVTNPGGAAPVTLPAAFTVEETRAPQLWSDIISRSAVRAGAPVRFTIVYGNRGNVDAADVPLTLLLPKDFVFDPVFAVAAPPASPSQSFDDFRTVPIAAGVDTASDLVSIPLLLPVVPAGFTGTIDYILTLPVGTPHGAEFLVAVKMAREPWLGDDARRDATVADLVRGARAYAERSFGTPVPGSVDTAAVAYARMQLDAIAAGGRAELVALRGESRSLYSVGQIAIDLAAFMVDQTTARSRWGAPLERFLALLAPGVDTAHAAMCAACTCADGPLPEGGCRCDKCEPPPPPTPPKPPKPGITPAECREIGKHRLSDDGSQCVPLPTNPCPLIPNPFFSDPDCRPIPIRQSVDPNDKTPSAGSGPEHVVTGAEPLKYAIAFENKPEATGAAQVVQIIDQLDTASLDLSTFSFGPISIGGIITIIPPQGLAEFHGGADLRPGNDILVLVDAYLDQQSGVATWTFTSVDPETMQLTDDADAGFLPPNTNPPDGEGRVFYTVAAKSTVATGTVIKNKASIVFDVNAPIETPEVSNTIDKTPPVSAVTSADVDDACDTSITVNWSGTDEGSIIADYSVFVSVNGGPFTLWQESTTATSAVYEGTTGNSYAFYSVARDIVDNTEAVPGAADVTRVLAVCGNENDLAITKLKAPKTVKLTARQPSKTVKIAVDIQNRSRHVETIPDVATLAALVDVTVDSAGACADPVATFRVPKKPKVIVLKPGRKLKLLFDATFACANDPEKGAGHTDFSLSAHVDHAALGGSDAHPADDVCPRTVAPPGELDPYPAKPVLDKGCGEKKPDKTFGAPVLVDVVGP